MIWIPPTFDEVQLFSQSNSKNVTRKKSMRCRTPGEKARSPVTKLNADLLYRIFEINARMEVGEWERGGDLWDFRALITTRHTSQVCHLWREIILCSSSIWAKAFDLQLLDQDSDLWREEVLRRTGKAFIHLRGIVRGHHRKTRQFFERVIMENWGRIRVLDVEIYHARTFNPEIWNVLTRPAPHLQSLSLRFRPSTPSPLSLPHGPIFDNVAPSLREFFVEQLTFDPQSLWLSRLRKFGVHATKNTPFNASQVLEIISHMPLLESLTLANAFPDDTPDRLDTIQSIELPQLLEIIIPEMELKVCIAILGKIIPGRKCVLDMFCKQRLDRGVGDSPTVADKHTKTVLARYLTAFFGSHVVSFVSLRRFHGVFTLRDGHSGNNISSGRGSRFRISIDHYDPSFLFDIYSSCRYSEVKHLELCLDQPDHDTAKLFPSMTTFLQQFKSVQSLSVDQFMLHYLNSIPEEASLFPSLKHVSMIGTIFFRDLPESPSYNTLARFLSRFSAIGASIQSLDLSGCKPIAQDIRILGEGLSNKFGIEVRV